jgi:hypothetical protein
MGIIEAKGILYLLIQRKFQFQKKNSREELKIPPSVHSSSYFFGIFLVVNFVVSVV